MSAYFTSICFCTTFINTLHFYLFQGCKVTWRTKCHNHVVSNNACDKDISSFGFHGVCPTYSDGMILKERKRNSVKP